jgi:predicted DNA-binding transcriptional regulator YafY
MTRQISIRLDTVMPDQDDVRWGLKSRFELIEWRAYWTGRVNRGDLEEAFGVSTPQASLDLRAYDAAAPGNITYNATEKAYLPTAAFEPKFLRLSADRYLLQLDAILKGAIVHIDTWFRSPPPAAVMPEVARSVEPATLRAVLRAITARDELDVKYQSLTNTRERPIAPHALAFDGNRWHTRSWCPERHEFRDFVLSRIESVGASRPSAISPDMDVEWHSFVDLKIAAHPGLDAERRATVERDFGMQDGLLILNTRVALSFYMERRWLLDLSDDVIPALRKQVTLTNAAEVEEARRSAKEAAQARIAATVR